MLLENSFTGPRYYQNDITKAWWCLKSPQHACLFESLFKRTTREILKLHATLWWDYPHKGTFIYSESVIMSSFFMIIRRILCKLYTCNKQHNPLLARENELWGIFCWLKEWTLSTSVIAELFIQDRVLNGPQRAHDAIMTSLWRQSDVATSFARHNYVIIAPCVRWVVFPSAIKTPVVCVGSGLIGYSD